jgi:hypothetical protein
VFTVDNELFLQNLQDCAYNSMRYKVPEDDLQSRTVPFHDPNQKNDTTVRNDSDEESEAESIELNDLDECQIFMNRPPDPDDSNTDLLGQKLHALSFREQRNKGVMEAGYKSVPPVTPLDSEHVDVALQRREYDTRQSASAAESPKSYKHLYRRSDIVSVVFSRTNLRKRQDVFKNNPDVQVRDATGSAASIVAWGRAAELDNLQQRAFESICAAVVLTFMIHQQTTTVLHLTN